MDGCGLGPKQRAWITAGYRYFFDDGLSFPEVFIADGHIPIAALPGFARGRGLEVMFGWCMADLREQRAGWLNMVSLLIELGTGMPAAD